MFQHTATRRWLHIFYGEPKRIRLFQHTATRRWLPIPVAIIVFGFKFQHTATRRWLLIYWLKINLYLLVSTHSHPKVAADGIWQSVDGNGVSTHSHPKVAAK